MKAKQTVNEYIMYRISILIRDVMLNIIIDESQQALDALLKIEELISMKNQQA